jgi:hypothetical protein
VSSHPSAVCVLLLLTHRAFPDAATDCGWQEAKEQELLVESCAPVPVASLAKIDEWAARHVNRYSSAAVEMERLKASYRGVTISVRTVVKDAGSPQTEPWPGGPAAPRDPVRSQLFLNTHEARPCDGLPVGTWLRATVQSACCDGDPNPPCYLGLRNYVERIVKKRLPKSRSEVFKKTG